MLVGMTYYFAFLNLERQMMSAAFLMLALPYAWRKRLLPFLILTGIAVGFHTTSVVFLLVYPLFQMHLQLKSLLLITILIWLSVDAFGDVSNAIFSYLPYYSDYLHTYFADIQRGSIVLAINIFLTLFCTLFYQKNNIKYQAYYLMQVIVLWIVLLTGQVVMVDRFRMTFVLFSIILIPMALKGISDRRIRFIAGSAVILAYIAYAQLAVGVGNAQGVIPYQTIFDVII